MASIPPSEIASEEAHINENHGPLLIALCTIFTGLAFLLFALRVFARRVSRSGFASDDWLALLALVSPQPNENCRQDVHRSKLFLLGLNITACMLASDGIGRHLLWVVENAPGDFDKIRIVGHLHCDFPSTSL